MRLALAGAVAVLAACGTSNDDRPLTINYVTAAVLQPMCGAAQCHSTFSQNQGVVLDNVSGVRTAMVGAAGVGLIRFDSMPHYDPADPFHSNLIAWLTETDPLARGIGRMPWDQPMPNEDIAFLAKWIQNSAPGAQCDPQANAGMACNNNAVFLCKADWNFGAQMMACPNGCVNGACL
jgi:hypothetical protein